MPKKTIALVTAPNMRYVNTGMTTVELAAKSLFAEAAPDSDISFYSIVPPNPSSTEKWMMMDLGEPHPSAIGIENVFKHKPIYGNIDQLFASDLIVYWGDFLQARHFLDNECVTRVSKIHHLTEDESRRLVYKSLLQHDISPANHNKSIIFGSSLLYNRACDYHSADYAHAAQDLFRSCEAALMRDPLSAARVNHLTGDFSRTHLGIDPAFLLKTDHLNCIPKTDWSSSLSATPTIALFFGTRTKAPEFLLAFCNELAEKLNAKLEWLPWFPLHEKLRHAPRKSFFKRSPSHNGLSLKAIENLMDRGDNYTQGDLLSALPKYKVVVTDTYHLCINAWRSGTPAICFGDESGNSSQVLQDFKKRVLYEMFNAQNFYFNASELNSSEGMKKLARRASALINDEEEKYSIIETIENQSGAIEIILKSHISTILNR